ncbi:Ribonuclease BN [Roseobacter fucihabitans]|uniref:Ribonuclease BN n=1 Tax=Roseobacter fucihabitans TaxID=1537242 RepID=A0ABZ2BWP5_9RHOB|nr:MBL fold metallo-hydrolase [Roseobacter litoralis]MBC6964549.1 putative quorum-quenching lactonase YtnP [Roseobacter litoralis]
MSDQMTLSRRAALAGAAALPLAAVSAGMSRAGAEIKGVAMSPFNRIKVGGFDVTTLLAGTRAVEGPHNIFGLNVDADTFAEVSAAANLPTDKSQFFFTPTVVNTGAELVLFDTGLSAEGTTSALEAAGYSADQIDVVVITHMHGDHIGGMTTGDGALTYGNARLVTGRTEFDAWAKADNDNFKAKIAPFAEQFTFLEDGADVASGLTAMAAFGHTPGHMTYMVEDGGTQLVIGADFANHYVWSLAHPDWEVKFDMDKAAAATTRRRMLDMMATDKTAFIGYHMPWPGVGYVEKRGDGFAYAPHSYQLML